MSDVFVDTSGWASLFIRSEPYHQAAVSLIHTARSAHQRIVTSNYVLTEFSALMISPLRVPREVRLVILDRIRKSDWVGIVHVDESHDAASWEYLLARRDKDFSLVDCSSFVMMRQRQIDDALTTDRHFDQAGFLRLLK